MIYQEEPRDWKDLQVRLATILREIGFYVCEAITIALARGQAEIDVYAEDPTTVPKSVYVIECKHWANPIPQSVVHSFRTIVADSGANHGLLVSKAGFQSGAFSATRHTNITLLGWGEFEQLFEARWFRQFAAPTMYGTCEPLISYTEPINATVTRAVKSLDEADRAKFSQLVHRYADLGYLIVYFNPLALGSWGEVPDPTFLPSVLRGVLPPDSPHLEKLASDDPLALRPFMQLVVEECTRAIGLFDELFGRRIVA